MEYGICHLSVVPIRSNSSDTSEMVSQLLFGETFFILQRKGKWTKICCDWDKYEGWIDTKQFLPISEKVKEEMTEQCTYSLELVQPAMTKNHYLPLLLGSTLPRYDGLNFGINGHSYTFSGQVINPIETKANVALLMKIARKYLYAPYLWGGRSPFGIDCSGFIQNVFKMVGIRFARDARQQVFEGRTVDFVGQSLPGDLAYFENPKGLITHVGLLLGDGEIIHSSGQVRIDLLDHHGIYDRKTKKYTHRLRIIKRIFQEEVSTLD